MHAVIPWFDQLWEQFERDMKRKPAPKDPVFATPTGNRLGSVKNGLAELLKEVDLLTDFRGIKRTSYSFRHFHISQQLIAGVDVFKVAKNTGTSSPMIDKYYGQLTLENMSKDLRPEWKKA